MRQKSPENRIVIDLDGTLVAWDPHGEPTLELRPGVGMLLQNLVGANKTLILWTGSNQERVNSFLNAYPHLRDYFSEIYTRDRLPPIDRLSRDFSPEKLLFIKDICDGYWGGKYPPLVDSKTVIDDTRVVGKAAEELGDFQWIDASSKEGDRTKDYWVYRILTQLEIPIR